MFELSGAGIPDFYGAVGGGGGNVAAIWRELYAGDRLLVAAQD
jgi:hypothetical protein